MPHETQRFDLVLANATLYDGTGAPPRTAHVALKDDRVVAISDTPFAPGSADDVVDCTGLWLTPGFIDLHTHYDAEVEVNPGLDESVRHGVTSVVVGSCSLSLAVGTPEDLADMFARVEALPYDVVKRVLDEKKTWDSHRDYLDHLDALPLGPNIASFVGHSALRVHTMGMARALDKNEKPTDEEMARMRATLDDALDAGYLGLSVQTLPWDKMGGTREVRSRPLPSTFSTWGEKQTLAKRLRERGRVFQGVPDVSTKWNVILFLLESMGILRKPLKTTVISMMDIQAAPGIHKLIGAVSRFVNRFFNADFKWQALPDVFELWADGIDLVVFEEFGAGAAALHLEDEIARKQLLDDPKYRAWFRRQWTSKLMPKAFHRDFGRSKVLACPDASVVGKSFAEIGAARGVHATDAFLDLVVAHGKKLRWYTVMANEKETSRQEIVSHDDVLIGFSDAGAHLRQMAHYNFPLRMLKLVVDANKRGAPFLTVERAVHRLTKEIAEWLGLDAGVIAPGKRADLVLIDPRGLDDDVDATHEAPIPAYDGYVRLVHRNPRAIRGVFVGGQRAITAGEPTPALGRVRMGRVLRARDASAAPKRDVSPALA